MNAIFRQIIWTAGLILFAGAAFALTSSVLTEIVLPVPESPEHRDYLGLSEKTSFRIPDIPADVVIIEIFSMYCPHCQREAPSVNKLFRKIEADKELKDKVRLIGIGIGNSDFEVSFFRKTFDVPFPLFADGDYVIHKKLGEVRTPYFMAISLRTEGEPRIFYSKLGGIKSPDSFLKMIRREVGSK